MKVVGATTGRGLLFAGGGIVLFGALRGQGLLGAGADTTLAGPTRSRALLGTEGGSITLMGPTMLDKTGAEYMGGRHRD